MDVFFSNVSFIIKKDIDILLKIWTNPVCTKIILDRATVDVGGQKLLNKVYITSEATDSFLLFLLG